MPRFERAILVANPTSGLGKTGRWIQRVADALREGLPDVRVVMTRRAGDARAAAADAGRGALVVTFGGDGTLNETLNGADLAATTLAVIPAGTGNVFAKELGMSRHPAAAARQILHGKAVRLDSGLCNGRRFLCMFGAGIDGRAVERVHSRRGAVMTQLHYVPHVVRSTLEAPRTSISVHVDGRPFVDGACQVSVGNTHSYGGLLELTPAAAPDDGLLDIMCIPARDPFTLAGAVVLSLMRALHLTGSVQYRRGGHVEVRSAEPAVPYELDGEAAGTLPARIEIDPASVTVIAPRAFHPVRKRPGSIPAVEGTQ
jgi:diacylglycerol kinase (ATP)